MVTVGEEIEAWKEEYTSGDTVHKYILHTLLLLQKFKIEQEVEWLKTQKEVTREEFEKALSH